MYIYIYINIYIYIYIYIICVRVCVCVCVCVACDTCVTCPISLERTVKKFVTCHVTCVTCYVASSSVSNKKLI